MHTAEPLLATSFGRTGAARRIPCARPLSANPDNVNRAISMIKQFKSVTLGEYYHREIPTRWYPIVIS